MIITKSKFFDARQVFVFIYIVSLFCHVSCVLVNVTRKIKHHDTFAYPVAKDVSCRSDSNIKAACRKGNAHPSGDYGCICACAGDNSTFLTSELSCVENWKIRNKSGNSWTFLLFDERENVGTPVGVLRLTANVNIIKIKMNPILDIGNTKTCQPYRVEIREKNGSWTLVNNQILTMGLFPNLSKISSNLTLQWIKGSVTAYPFAGKIMRIRINCTTVDDFIIFKVAGTFQVEIPEISSESSFATPTLSAFPLTNSIVINTTHVFSTASISSHQHYSLSPPAIQISSTITFSVNSSIPEIMHSKDSSSTKVIIGAVIGVVLALIIVVLIVFYILRRKKNLSGNLAVSGQFDNKMQANKNFPLPTLANPVCEDLVYHNPENVQSYKKRKSGIKSIDNADYDQCIVVENPSARNGVGSVYDNISSQQTEEEPTYHALNPAKREPSNKYQSLVKPDNEYSTIRDGAGTPSQEPVYSVVDDEPHKNKSSDSQPKQDPVYNILETNDSSLQTVPEPVYNVLEQSNEIQGKQEPVYSELEDK